jgi:O-antigen ligase
LANLKLGAIPAAGWAFLAWAIASLAWSVETDVALSKLTTLVQLFVIAVFIADFVVRRPSIVRPVLWAYSLSAAATAAIGVAAYLAQGLSTARSSAIQDQDPAQFAAVLVPAFVFGLYEAINGGRVLLGAGIATLASAGIVVSGTRGAWVACAVVILFVVLPQLNARRRVIAIVTMAVVAAGVYQVPGVADLVAERSGNAVASGGAGRTDIWTVGATIFESRPIAGVGYANFPVAFTTQSIREAGLVVEGNAIPGRGSHNIIVATAVELGVVGLVLLVAFVGPLLLRRGWGRDAATVQAALIGLMTTALFLDILSNRKQVWLVIALAAGLSYIARVERARLADMPAHGASEPPSLVPSSPERRNWAAPRGA